MPDECSIVVSSDDFDLVSIKTNIPPGKNEPGQKALPEHNDMEFPSWIWVMMFVGYGLFFICMILATGSDSGALFAITVSVAYTVMYFATAGILVGLKPATHKSSFARGLAPLQTYTGSMSAEAVVSQVLVIPFCLALFGVAIVCIRAVVM